MMKDVESAVKVGFANIKKSPNDYYEAVKAELAILDLQIDNRSIFVAGALVLEHKTLTKVRTVLSDLSDEQFTRLADAEQLRLSEYKTRQAEEARVKKEREKERSRALAEKKKENAELISDLVKAFTPVFKGANQSSPSAGFSEYTVIARAGDDSLDLRRPVNKALADGWIPQGGIHIAGPLSNGVMLFSQAMVFPAGRKPKNYDY
jgi:hypothetical protein